MVQKLELFRRGRKNLEVAGFEPAYNTAVNRSNCAHRCAQHIPVYENPLSPAVGSAVEIDPLGFFCAFFYYSE
jgi:hypothetical protein